LGEEAAGSFSIHVPRSTICNPISSAFLCDLGGLAVNLSERIGAARPRRPTGDGLGQDVPATVKMRARCPRTLVESGFISDLVLSTFGPSTLHFQNLSVLVFQLLPDGVGQMLVQAEKFRKKFRSLPITHLRVPLKHADPLLSSHFGVFSEAREHPLGVAEADRAFVTILSPPSFME
jgi:hypothetical protein